MGLAGNAQERNRMTQHPAPPDLGPELVASLRLSKQALLALGPLGTVHQTGGGYVGDRFDLGPAATELPVPEEPRVETFMVDEAGRCTPTGTDEGLIAALQDPAERLARAIIEAMAHHGVKLADIGYLSASLTAAEQVTTTPHVDDDQFIAGDGVGMVAIAATAAGPRIATAPVTISGAHGETRPGLPLELDEATLARFDDGSWPAQQAEGSRIVVFPQFGQVHSGPPPGPTSPAEGAEPGNGARALLVYRVATIPVG